MLKVSTSPQIGVWWRGSPLRSSRLRRCRRLLQSRDVRDIADDTDDCGID
jgi:hypothetical protein